jgi:hypothetical protein
MKNSFFLLLLAALLISTTFTSCEKECTSPFTKQFETQNFTGINAGNEHVLNIVQGSALRIEAKGCIDDVEDLKLEVKNNILHISYNLEKNKRRTVRFDITVPSLTFFDFSGSTQIFMTGFSTNDTLKGFISGSSNCKITANAKVCKLLMSGTTDADFGGSIERVELNISGQSKYNGYAVAATKDVLVDASGQTVAKVKARDLLNAVASGQAKIYCKGNPSNKFTVETGKGQIIFE